MANGDPTCFRGISQIIGPGHCQHCGSSLDAQYRCVLCDRPEAVRQRAIDAKKEELAELTRQCADAERLKRIEARFERFRAANLANPSDGGYSRWELWEMAVGDEEFLEAKRSESKS